jgi:hypothetical protein
MTISAKEPRIWQRIYVIAAISHTYIYVHATYHFDVLDILIRYRVIRLGPLGPGNVSTLTCMNCPSNDNTPNKVFLYPSLRW